MYAQHGVVDVHASVCVCVLVGGSVLLCVSVCTIGLQDFS